MKSIVLVCINIFSYIKQLSKFSLCLYLYNTAQYSRKKSGLIRERPYLCEHILDGVLVGVGLVWASSLAVERSAQLSLISVLQLSRIVRQGDPPGTPEVSVGRWIPSVSQLDCSKKYFICSWCHENGSFSVNFFNKKMSIYPIMIFCTKIDEYCIKR